MTLLQIPLLFTVAFLILFTASLTIKFNTRAILKRMATDKETSALYLQLQRTYQETNNLILVSFVAMIIAFCLHLVIV